MPTVALALADAIASRLGRELARNGYQVLERCSDAADLAEKLQRIRPDVVMVSALPRFLDEKLIAACDLAGVRMVAVAGADVERRHASSVGLREVVDVDAPWSLLEPVLAGPSVGAAPGAGQGERGYVIAVWGPAGAPGRTTVAISVAAELAAAGFSVALADVDTHGASVAPTLGLLDEAPGFAAACRLAGADALNRGELERIGQRYLSSQGSFWVLTGIGRPNRWPELSAERVVATIRECRGWVDYLVLDTGSSLENDEEISSDLLAPRRNAATIAALRGADQVIAVGSGDPVGLSRFLRAHVDLVEVLETDRVSVLINKIRASAIGMDPFRQVTQTLQRFGGITAPALVPHDLAALDAAVLSGKTLLDIAPKSSARVAIGKFVESRILPHRPATATGRAKRSRFEPVTG